MCTKSLKSVDFAIDNFGHMQENGAYVPIKRFTWKNQNRVQIQVINYGAIITSIKTPNKRGIIDDITIGFDDIKGYLDNSMFYYGIIGRYANYIRGGNFVLNRKEFHVRKNLGKHHYNGGNSSFDKVLWEYFVNGNKVILSHFTPDGDEGYPGDLMTFVMYELTPTNEFRIDIKAYSTKATIINLSNSLFFNLGGHNTGPEEISRHELIINADCYTVTDSESISTGEIKSVTGTMYDFQIPIKLGGLIEKFDGFNTNFCLTRGTDQGNCFAARLFHPESGRLVEIYTNQYGLQFETCNNFPEKQEQGKPVKKVSPYIKTNPASFDLIDEIHNRVADIMAKDKTPKYGNFLKFLKDLQKKESTMFRSSSSTTNFASKLPNLIKRSKITLDNVVESHLSSQQLKYVERILEKINEIPDSLDLIEIKDILEKVYGKYIDMENLPKSAGGIDKPEEEYTNRDMRGKKGAKYIRHCAVCLQTQNYPDACNNSNFPTSLLKPGGVYHHTVVYKFFIKTNNMGISGFV